MMRLGNPALADMGRRLMGSARAAPPAARPGDVALSGELALTLRLGATACQVDEAEFVRRAIAEKASRLGLPALAGIKSQAKASEDNGATGPAMNVCPADCVAGEASRVDAGRTASATSEGMDVTGGESAATSFLAALNSDGDLIAVPDFRRATIPRFASGP